VSAVVETSVVARKWHWCEEYRDPHKIEPGETYARLVAFPDGDTNTGTKPWVMRLCVEHFTQYGRTMPPSKRRPAPAGADQ
jgi:hypothetical protein